MERLSSVRSRIAIGVLFGIVLIGCGGDESSTPDVGNGALEHSVEKVEDRLYDCFTYTTADRGGIACDRITASEVSALPESDHNGAIAISIETVDGRDYDCFAYTTEDRGGLECVPVS